VNATSPGDGEEKVLAKGVFPTIRAGKQDELTMISNELGVSNHSVTEEDGSKRPGKGTPWCGRRMWLAKILFRTLPDDVSRCDLVVGEIGN